MAVATISTPRRQLRPHRLRRAGRGRCVAPLFVASTLDLAQRQLEDRGRRVPLGGAAVRRDELFPRVRLPARAVRVGPLRAGVGAPRPERAPRVRAPELGRTRCARRARRCLPRLRIVRPYKNTVETVSADGADGGKLNLVLGN